MSIFVTRCGRGEIIVDDRDFDWLAKFSWSLVSGRAWASMDACRVPMHRLLCPAPSGMVVDHKNRNPLDNRRENLRACTHAENMRNRRSNYGSAPYRGVYQVKGGKYWARCTVGGQLHRDGPHATAEGAARGFDRLAASLHGDFAVLNFPGAQP